MSEIFAFAPPLPIRVVSLAVVSHMELSVFDLLYSAKAVIPTGNQETSLPVPSVLPPRFVPILLEVNVHLYNPAMSLCLFLFCIAFHCSTFDGEGGV